jgi:hypothetical protein
MLKRKSISTLFEIFQSRNRKCRNRFFFYLHLWQYNLLLFFFNESVLIEEEENKH